MGTLQGHVMINPEHPMTRPIDETWHLEHLLVVNQAGKMRFGSGSPAGVDLDEDQAALRLAAAAPAMARLLVDLEWGADICIGYDNITALGCPSCGGLQHDPGNRADFDHQTVGHDPDCELVAVLRAAGVVE